MLVLIASGFAPASAETAPTAEEHGSAQPRLVMIEADTGTVVVMDVGDGEVIARLPSAVDSVSPGEAPGQSGDGRFTFFSHHAGNSITIVDAGTWMVPHGTHAHHYTTAPAITGIVEGLNPTHAVTHDGIVALFFDGTGEVVALDEQALRDGSVTEVARFSTGGPHHGVAVPVDDCFLTSLPIEGDPAARPASIGLFCDGELQRTIADCHDLHGEAMLGTAVVFGCADGVVSIETGDGSWAATATAYPDVDDTDLFGAPRPRVWGLTGARGSRHLFAWAGSDHLFVLDADHAAETMRAVELSAPFTVFGLAAVPGSRDGLVLTTDGSLQRIDLETGAVVDRLAVVDPFQPDLTFETPQHVVVAQKDRAFVLDPTAQRIVEIDLRGGMSPGRVLQLDAAMTQLTLAGG
jgi:hypothetical protein